MSSNMRGFVAVPEILKDDEYVTFLSYVHKGIVPWADVSLAVCQVKKEIPPELSNTYSQPHTHEVIETYAVAGDLTIEVDIEGEKHLISSPAAIVIPPGVKRCWRVVKGVGYLVLEHIMPED